MPNSPFSSLRALLSKGPLQAVAWLLLGLTVASVTEFGLFNLRHWSTIGTEPITLDMDSAVVRGLKTYPTTGGLRFAKAKKVEEVSPGLWGGKGMRTYYSGSVEFRNLNVEIKSIWLDLKFLRGNARADVLLGFDDEGGSERESKAGLMAGRAPLSQYIRPSFMGHTRRLEVTIDSNWNKVELRGVVLNKPIPLDFRWLRFAGVAVLVALLGLSWSRHWWRIRLEPGCKKQKWIQVAVAAGLAFLAVAGVFGTVTHGDSLREDLWAIRQAKADQYSRLTNALGDGRLSLEETVNSALEQAERPYDPAYREEQSIGAMWDYAYYDGKYYSYFGVVPAALVLLPFYKLTGIILASRLVFIGFAVLAVVALWLLWRDLARRYNPRLPFWLYLACGVTLVSISNIYYLSARGSHYDLPVAAGLFFAVTGTWLTLRAGWSEKRKWILLQALLGALSLALAVGCRPHLLLVSAIVPVALWPVWQRRQPGTRTRLLAAVGVPYAVIGGLLAAYNYARFGSIFEFGANYQLTVADVGAYFDKDWFGLIATALSGIGATLFATQSAARFWPFLEPPNFFQDMPGYVGYFYAASTTGLIYLPVLWCLAGLFFLRRQPKSPNPGFRLVAWTLALVGVVVMVVSIIGAGLHGRYQTDYLWLLAAPALILLSRGANLALERGLPHRAVNPTALGLLAVTVFVIGSIGLTGEWGTMRGANPDYYWQLQTMFKFW